MDTIVFVAFYRKMKNLIEPDIINYNENDKSRVFFSFVHSFGFTLDEEPRQRYEDESIQQIP